MQQSPPRLSELLEALSAGVRPFDYNSPTHPCAFHAVGEQLYTMYLGALPGTPIRGVQTWDVPPGGGMCFEPVCDVPGEFPFVDHGFGHDRKGAIGFLVVER